MMPRPDRERERERERERDGSSYITNIVGVRERDRERERERERDGIAYMTDIVGHQPNSFEDPKFARYSAPARTNSRPTNLRPDAQTHKLQAQYANQPHHRGGGGGGHEGSTRHLNFENSSVRLEF
jgi:hypothetical protein